MNKIYIIISILIVFSILTNISFSKHFNKNLKTNYYGSRNKKRIIKRFNKKLKKIEAKEAKLMNKRKKNKIRKIKKKNVKSKTNNNIVKENTKGKYFIVGSIETEKRGNNLLY